MNTRIELISVKIVELVTNESMNEWMIESMDGYVK